jgi:hypothetical protein
MHGLRQNGEKCYNILGDIGAWERPCHKWQANTHQCDTSLNLQDSCQRLDLWCVVFGMCKFREASLKHVNECLELFSNLISSLTAPGCCWARHSFRIKGVRSTSALPADHYRTSTPALHTLSMHPVRCKHSSSSVL